MPRAVPAALFVAISMPITGCRAASVEQGRPAASAVDPPARTPTEDAHAAKTPAPTQQTTPEARPPDRRLRGPSPGIDLRSGTEACALCPGPVPRIVVAGRPGDPDFVERARDADAVAAKYRGRLEARIVARHGSSDALPRAETGTNAPTGGDAFTPPAWVARLRVDAPVIAAEGPLALPEAYATLAAEEGPLVFLILDDGEVVYAAAAPDDFAALHDAFLAHRSGPAGPPSDRG